MKKEKRIENPKRKAERKTRLRERKERACCRENKASKGFGKREKAGYKSKGRDRQRRTARVRFARKGSEKPGRGERAEGKAYHRNERDKKRGKRDSRKRRRGNRGWT